MEHQVLIFHEKHGRRVFVCPTNDDVWKVCRMVLQERIDEGYYEDDEELNAQDACRSGQAAWEFLDRRSRYEYENMDADLSEEY